MALSEREQQVLRDLESQLHQEDPGLADTMDSRTTGPLRLSPRHIGAGVALVLVGMSLVVGGVVVRNSVISILLGVVGFGMAVWGVTLALTRVEAGGGPGSSRRPSRRSSFMDRQSQRWDRRRGSQG
ncbi:DUF3040 domain-containing protein [Actinomyces sp. 2119]|uniref:DUF3040 domain-containing protein n=1 Tax=Actinomyces lilanjuaniae TaxID=2321394 RepID=A0ABN5PSD0_9ACTO|nr:MULTISPECIES: DUF3040 domain-containing protein [Actinomyces]AYD89586.1 DUF3040 domain-containing protein [Actinomyces lilanjuaniae]RJF43047.1 DUF3040 domain-containing protein [Actinomyces sp. 2119]